MSRTHILGLVVLAWIATACGTRATPDDARRPRALESSEARAASPVAAAAPARGMPAFANEPGTAVGTHGAVASAEGHASQVGLDVLKAGGNAIDAAVAVAFALAVTHPSGGNIGGGGFMIVRMAHGESVAIDYREIAPSAATPKMYLDAKGEVTEASVTGALAAGIPGTIDGMRLAHERFGKKPWAALLTPAIVLARDGHALDTFHADALQSVTVRMREAGFAGTARLYSNADGSALAAGAIWKQPELARTLSLVAEQGARAFYEGPFAEQLASKMRALGGIWKKEDLAGYRAKLREPVKFPYRGHEIITMPPPSAGGIVMRQILFASERLDLEQYPWRSAREEHLYLEAARRAFADRSVWIADPDFVTVPMRELLDPKYIDERMRDIDPEHATPSARVKPGEPLGTRHESMQTTHFSVVDDAGNAVANTYTLNDNFGALLAVPGTGILLNDEMDDFSAAPGKPNLYGLVQGERNAIAPGKRMLSSMTPTIVTKDGALRAVLGSPGGPTITTTVTQLVRALVDHGRPLPEAVLAGRLHHQWLPDQVSVEANVEASLVRELRALGHEVVSVSSGRIGHADCIEVDPLTRGYRAVADVTRGGGSALAY